MNKALITKFAHKHKLPTVVEGMFHVVAIDRVNAFALDIAGATVEHFLEWVKTAPLEDGKSAVDQYKDFLFDSIYPPT